MFSTLSRHRNRRLRRPLVYSSERITASSRGRKKCLNDDTLGKRSSPQTLRRRQKAHSSNVRFSSKLASSSSFKTSLPSSSTLNFDSSGFIFVSYPPLDGVIHPNTTRRAITTTRDDISAIITFHRSTHLCTNRADGSSDPPSLGIAQSYAGTS